MTASIDTPQVQDVEIKVNEVLNWFYSDYKDELVQVHTIKGNSLDECFRNVYELRRSSRYDSARKYVFVDTALEAEYQEWKQNNETIQMYYGSGTVD